LSSPTRRHNRAAAVPPHCARWRALGCRFVKTHDRFSASQILSTETIINSFQVNYYFEMKMRDVAKSD
jgi:hypothetical protein